MTFSVLPRRRRRVFFALLALSFCLTGLLLWHLRGRTQTPVDPALVVTVKRDLMLVEVIDVGVIEGAETVEIASRIPGRTARVWVKEGDRVKAGDPLLQLETRDFRRELSRARVELQKTTAQKAFWQLESKRRTRMVKAQVISGEELVKARHEARLAAISQQAARVAVRVARDQLSYAEIRSPIAGTVTRRSIEPGEMVKPGVQSSFESVSLLTIQDLSNLIVKIDLNQIDVAKVKLGQSVTLRLDAFPKVSIRAEIFKVAMASVRRPGKDVDVFPVEARLEKNNALAIRPGMTADVRILIEKRTRVLTLPQEAIRRTQKGALVTRLEGRPGENRQTKVQIRLGAENDHRVEVLTGLKAGERVLLDPPSADDNETKI